MNFEQRFVQFESQMSELLQEIQLSDHDKNQRVQLIQFIRAKLKNRNFDQPGYDGPTYYDTGLDLEIYGSYPAGLSTKNSDLDIRVNDFYTYRYLNLEILGKNLTYSSYFMKKQGEAWTGPKANALSKSRLRIIEHFKTAKVPVLKMLDSVTGIEIDISQGSSSVNNRHIQICNRAQQIYPELGKLILVLKKYLAIRNCLSSYSGGLSSFLLFYLVLAYFQNMSQNKRKDQKLPEIAHFLWFYSNFDEDNNGLQIDYSELFPEEGYSPSKKFNKIIQIQQGHHNYTQNEDGQSLYLKDPIGKIYFSDPSEYYTYRENIGESAFEYKRVKSYFEDSWKKLKLSQNPQFDLFLKDDRFEEVENYDIKEIHQLNLDEVQQQFELDDDIVQESKVEQDKDEENDGNIDGSILVVDEGEAKLEPDSWMPNTKQAAQQDDQMWVEQKYEQKIMEISFSDANKNWKLSHGKKQKQKNKNNNFGKINKKAIQKQEKYVNKVNNFNKSSKLNKRRQQKQQIFQEILDQIEIDNKNQK